MGSVHRSPDYRPDQERGLHLSFLVGDATLHWCVQDSRTGRALALGEASVSQPLDDPALPLEPASVSFLALPEWSTLVPSSALLPGSEADHLALVHGRLPSGVMRDEPVEQLGARCIYVHDDQAEHRVLQRWPGARSLPLSAVLLRAAGARCKERPVVLLHRGPARVDLVVNAGDRVLLNNSFPARAPADVLYFTLLALDGCGLRADAVDLRVGGMQLLEAERRLLERHVLHVDAAHDADMLLALPPLEHPERWLALLEQLPCVS